MRQGIQVALDLRRHFGDACQQAKAELASNDGGRLDRALHRLLQPIDPSADDVLNGGGELDRRATPPEDFSVPADQRPALEEITTSLLDPRAVFLGLRGDAPD